MSTKRQAQLKAAAEGREFIDDTLPKTKNNTSGHYVKNADLLAEIKKSRESGELTETCALMFKQFLIKLFVINP